MREFELSPDAQEAMRGDFVLAGEQKVSVMARDLGELAAVSEVSFHDRLENFFDTSKPLAASEQMTVMNEFWGSLGYQMPQVPENMWENLVRNVDDNPGFRIFPTRIPKYSEGTTAARSKFVESIQEAYPANFTEGGSGFAKYQTIYNRYTCKHVIRYKTPLHDIVPREQVGHDLLQSGYALRASDRQTWVYPLLGKHQEKFISAREVYDSLSALALPEVFLTLRALQKVCGVSNLDMEDNYYKHFDLTNEAAYPARRSKRLPDYLARAVTAIFLDAPGVTLRGTESLLTTGQAQKRPIINALG